MCAIQSICDYLTSHDGTVEIHNNAPGCNSPEEVQHACDSLPVPEISKPCSLMIHPNPFYETTTISFELDSRAGIEIKIYDRLGRIVREFSRQDYPTGTHSIIWHAEELPAGIYILRLQTGEKSIISRLIKL
jgi:serine protease AprX